MCLLNKFTACFVTAKFRSVRADIESVSRMREGEKVVRGGNGGVGAGRREATLTTRVMSAMWRWRAAEVSSR